MWDVCIMYIAFDRRFLFVNANCLVVLKQIDLGVNWNLLGGN